MAKTETKTPSAKPKAKASAKTSSQAKAAEAKAKQVAGPPRQPGVERRKNHPLRAKDGHIRSS